MILRAQAGRLKDCLSANKIVLLNGPKRVGKRELVRLVMQEMQTSAKELDVVDKSLRKELDTTDSGKLKELFDNAPFVLINEAQYLENLQHLIELVLGGEISSTLILCCSFDPLLDDVLREVLQMQGLEIQLLPPSFYELAQHFSLPEEEKQLENRLVFGNFPLVTEYPFQAKDFLIDMIADVTSTQLGVTDRINKSEQLTRLLQIIAYNIGEPLSYNEIGEKAGLDNETVERYTDLLERSFILFKLPSFYNGHRYELKKSHVFYFVDNGIRNALINNFNPLFMRNDVDQLWRNWLISERIKWNGINGKKPTYFFWRTHTRQTMDFIEQDEQKTAAYKSSWEKKKKIKFPASFTEAYPEISTHTLNRSTYWGFLTKK